MVRLIFFNQLLDSMIWKLNPTIVNKSEIKLFILIILLFLPSQTFPQSTDQIEFVSNEKLQEGLWLQHNWNYMFEEDTSKRPEDITFKDSLLTDCWDVFKYLPEEGWQGEVWLYKKINVDSSVAGTPFMLNVIQSGKMEIFIDGEYAGFLGYNNRGELVSALTAKFNKPGVNVILVKYTNENYREFITAGLSASFYLSISSIENYNYETTSEIEFQRSIQMFFTAFTLAFALLHLILFIYLRELKSNFYFFLFLMAYMLNIFFDHQALLSGHLADVLYSLRIQRATLPFIQIFSLVFLYSLYFTKIPKYFWILTFLLVTAGALVVYSPINNQQYFNIVSVLCLFEIFRVLSFYIQHKVNGAKLISLGFIILFFFSSYDILNDLGIVGSIGRLTNAYMFGAAGLTIVISISLAKEFGRINRKIVKDESNLIIIEADNKRKTEELEEARKLQLSLLPNCADEMMGYEVCFDMITATEVGGDYYDYMITDNDTLTIVIGDATGHGMKAGNMVVLIKSLFNTMGHTFYIPDFFNHCTRQIKKMNFGNLFMSMTMIKLKRDNLVISTAGMPPVLIYKAVSNKVEEILIKGMPLGAHDQFPYYQNKFIVEKDDVVLLMTDGIGELFNSDIQMFGINRIKKILIENHNLHPNQIVAKLFDSTDQWRKEHPQNDDMTVIILKKK